MRAVSSRDRLGCLVCGDAQGYFDSSRPSRASWRAATCPLVYSALASRLRRSARTAARSPDGGEGFTEQGGRLCREIAVRIVARPRGRGRVTRDSRKEISTMDCCSHEGPSKGDAKFDIQKVADGVHVAVAAPAYKVNCNTAIIESDDGVVIVDTHSKPSAARLIVQELPGLTTKPVRYVVNTHFHWDHWHGNEVYPAAYPNAEIITNQITREAMATKGLKRIQDHIRQVPAEIAKLKADLAVAGSGERRAQLADDLKQAEAYQAEVTAMKPALPTMAFDRTMKLYRRDREIHLLYLGRAHTEGDVFVYLPKERTVITGDAVIGWTPYMGDGNPAGRDWLRTFRAYIHDMVEAVREEVGTGASLDEVKQRVPARLAPTYEKAFATYEHYRPWRAGLLANIERTYAMVS